MLRTRIYMNYAAMCQHWASTGPMLAASAQYWPSADMIYRVLTVTEEESRDMNTTSFMH